MTTRPVRALKALARERRRNRRLRVLIAEIQERLERHSRDLEIQFERIAQLQAELDVLKGATARSSGTAAAPD